MLLITDEVLRSFDNVRMLGTGQQASHQADRQPTQASQRIRQPANQAKLNQPACARLLQASNTLHHVSFSPNQTILTDMGATAMLFVFWFFQFGQALYWTLTKQCH